MPIAWRLDGRQLVTGAKPGGVEVWDIVVGKELKRRLTVPAIEEVLTISKDAGRAVDWTDDETLRVWDIECDGGRVLNELPVQFIVYSAVFLHNERQVAFCGEDNAIITREGKVTISGIALSQNGDILASSPLDQIQLFSTKSWDLLGSIQGYIHRTALWSPDDHRLLTSYNTIETLDLTSVVAPKPRITSSTLPNVIHESDIGFVTISSDGELVAAKSRGTISIWSLQSGLLSCTIRGYFIGNVAFSLDTQKIAIGEYRKTCIWDVTTTPPTMTRSIPTANVEGDRI